ncbi:flagellar basal body P-ring formation chaperone FlgA [Buchnera aphidicola]|uniref:flagellar basal body P-ring formation chaperone FlgA n=1 Tax=Buchnera aphidicola TaxID=9 RepID=UPI0031B70A99
MFLKLIFFFLYIFQVFFQPFILTKNFNDNIYYKKKKILDFKILTNNHFVNASKKKKNFFLQYKIKKTFKKNDFKKKNYKIFNKNKNFYKKKKFYKYFVASKFLKKGVIISKSDIKIKYLNIPYNISTSIYNIKNILNKKLINPLSPNQPFSYQNLHSFFLVKRGDIIPIFLYGKGFIIKVFGTSLQDAEVNQKIQILLNKKKIIFGKLHKEKKIYIFL